MPNNAFYGGGHSMKSARDFAFWCLQNTSIFYQKRDLFRPPSNTIGNYQGYQRVANAAAMAGVEIPERFADLFNLCTRERTFISPRQAMRTQGALLFHQNAVTVSLGDGTRVVYEEDFTLVMKYFDPSANPNEVFEWAATIPGMEY